MSQHPHPDAADTVTPSAPPVGAGSVRASVPTASITDRVDAPGTSVRFFSVGARGIRTVRWGFVAPSEEVTQVRSRVPSFAWRTLFTVLATGIAAGAFFGALITTSSEAAWNVAFVWGFVGALSLGIGYTFAELLGKTIEVLGIRKLIFFALPVGKVPVSVAGTFVISLLILRGLPYVFVLSGALYFALYALGVTILSYRSYFETQRNPLF